VIRKIRMKITLYRVKRRVLAGVRFLLWLDRRMKKEGWPRWRRTQFFRTLEKSPASREFLYNEIEKMWR